MSENDFTNYELEIPQLLRKLEENSGSAIPIEIRETHISKVFLTGSHAYKLKKPVKFDFLDFSTQSLRKQACENEFRLNRRMAPSVYQRVLPITQNQSGKIAIDGKGKPVDWLVKMHRLPDERSLQSLIETEQLTTDSVLRLAKWLTRFYDSLPPVLLEPGRFRRSINEHVIANRRDLLELPEHFSDHVVRRVHTAQLAYLHLFSDNFDNRVRDGRIVQGHGDLKPEHIYLNPEPLAIDCIEFSEEFRQLDVIDELSFLAMECRLSGASWVGDLVIEHYLGCSGDIIPKNLFEFYMAYRACVRAKVHLIQAHHTSEEAHRVLLVKSDKYLQLADTITHEMSDPLLIVVRGLAGVGKSTLAQYLSGLLGAELIQTDRVRQNTFGVSQINSAFNEGRYSHQNRQRVYDALFDQAARRLGTGVSVVLDGAFLSNELQSRAAQIAAAWGAQILLVSVHCPRPVVKERIQTRLQKGSSRSEADFSVYEKQVPLKESPPASIPQCLVDSTYAISAQGNAVFATLAELMS